MGNYSQSAFFPTKRVGIKGAKKAGLYRKVSALYRLFFRFLPITHYVNHFRLSLPFWMPVNSIDLVWIVKFM